ncbi:helix-turn-helix domain-containing protein [Mycobacterium marinum]|uniref:helix-turn-helix domain-containing protein n=1 Tax=Mycobacterium marinum TaxID=1781 RepID=UPI000E3CB9D9
MSKFNIWKIFNCPPELDDISGLDLIRMTLRDWSLHRQAIACNLVSMSRHRPPGRYKKPKGRLLSTTEAAAYLGVSIRTIHNYRYKGALVPCRVGRLWKYDPRDLDNFIETSTLQAINA